MQTNKDSRFSWAPILVIVAGLISLCALQLWFETAQSASWFSFFWLALGTLLILILHFVGTNLNPVDAMVSEYSDVPGYGHLMRAAFFSLSIGGINLAFSIHLYWGHNWLIFVPLGLAAFTTFLMGVFSMRTTATGLIHTSTLVGFLHGISAGTTFLLATVSMVLFACWPPSPIAQVFPWIRGTALEQFNISVVGLLIFIILGIGKTAEVKKLNDGHADLNTKHLLAEDFNYSIRNAQALEQEHIREKDDGRSRPVRSDTEKKIDQGGGLLERILIFMFFEWMFLLSCLIGAARR